MTVMPSPLFVGDHTIGIIPIRDGGPDTIGLMTPGGRLIYDAVLL